MHVEVEENPRKRLLDFTLGLKPLRPWRCTNHVKEETTPPIAPQGWLLIFFVAHQAPGQTHKNAVNQNDVNDTVSLLFYLLTPLTLLYSFPRPWRRFRENLVDFFSIYGSTGFARGTPHVTRTWARRWW